MADQILTNPNRVVDGDGNPVSGARVYVYESGGTTPVVVEDASATPLAWPVVADSEGYIPRLYLPTGTGAVKIEAYDADGLLISGYPIDPAIHASDTATGAAAITFSPITGNAATDVQDAIANNTAAILENNGLTSVSGTGYVVRLGANTYTIRAITAGDGALVTNTNGISGNTQVAADFASVGEAQAGTSAVKVMSPLRVKNAIDHHTVSSSMGTVDVTGSRAHSTNYQNSNTYPIHVCIVSSGAGAVAIEVSSDAATWFQVGWATSGGISRNTSFFVDPGWYYRINGTATIASWVEFS